jgi:hypothetical protein
LQYEIKDGKKKSEKGGKGDKKGPLVTGRKDKGKDGITGKGKAEAGINVINVEEFFTTWFPGMDEGSKCIDVMNVVEEDTVVTTGNSSIVTREFDINVCECPNFAFSGKFSFVVPGAVAFSQFCISFWKPV